MRPARSSSPRSITACGPSRAARRSGSRGEARALGLAHEILTWQGAKPSTGVQDAARTARYRLLAELAWRLAAPGPVAIVTAHTEDDQAETFLMRLARGSGLDGLTGMSESRILRPGASCRLLRPLLRVSGARLKATLERARAVLDRGSEQRVRPLRARAPAQGAGAARSSRSDQRSDRAQRATPGARARGARGRRRAQLETAAGLDTHGGAFASFDARVFQAAPEELRLRVLARLISAFGGQDAPARLAKLGSRSCRGWATPDFSAATLGGCIVTRHADEICVFREPGRAELPQLALAPGDVAVWDRRFRVGLAPAAAAPVRVRALGAAQFAQAAPRP